MSLEDTQGGAPAPVDVAPAPVADVAAPEPSAPADSGPKLEDDLSKVWAKNNPARADDGKFASRETPVKQDGTEPAPTGTAPEAVKPAQSAAPVVDPPRAWSAEQKALWSKIPPEAQPVIAQREAELQEIRSAAGRLEADIRPFRETLGAHKDYFQAIGQNPVEWMGNALQISRLLDSGKAPEVIKHLATQYGVDLGQIYDPLEPPPNRELIELRHEIAALKAARQSEVQSRAASQEAAQLSTLDNVVNEFKSKHPDASEIEDDIAAEIHAIRLQQPNLDHAALLQKAYERAAWGNEKTRAKRLEATVAEKLKAQEEARITAAKEAASKARSAANVNVAGSASPSGGEVDIDATLRGIWRKNQTR